MKTLFAKDRVDLGTSPAGPTEGARRATGVGPAGGDRRVSNVVPPDPEVPAHKRRRKLSAEYKLRILKEAEQCTQPGERGALLRREGLYSSSLTRWRRQREEGILQAMTPQKRGRKAVEKNPLAEEVARLQKENQHLRKKLWQAERIIDVQKKVSEILGADPESRSS